MQYYKFVAVRGKNETASISYSDTGHPNMMTKINTSLYMHDYLSNAHFLLDTAPWKKLRIKTIVYYYFF
jgi:hypothetical protein